MSQYVVVRELVSALSRNMRLRADGTRHGKDCFNAHVNSQSYPCSPGCQSDNAALKAGQAWLAENRPTTPKMRLPA